MNNTDTQSPFIYPYLSDKDAPESVTVNVKLSDGQLTRGWYEFFHHVWYVLDQTINDEVAVSATEIDYWYY